MSISTHRRYRPLWTVLHNARAFAAPIVIFVAHKIWLHTTARWDFRSSPQSPPRISAFWSTFELQVGASTRPSSWQQGALRCGKKVGWLFRFAMFFLPNYLIENSRPCPAIFCHSPSMPFKPPRPTPHAALSPHCQSNNEKKKQGNGPCKRWELQFFNFVNCLIWNSHAVLTSSATALLYDFQNPRPTPFPPAASIQSPPKEAGQLNVHVVSWELPNFIFFYYWIWYVRSDLPSCAIPLLYESQTPCRALLWLEL